MHDMPPQHLPTSGSTTSNETHTACCRHLRHHTNPQPTITTNSLACPQLPPVCNHRKANSDFCKECHLTEWAGWPTDDRVFELTQSVRHAADPTFNAALDVARTMVPSQDLLDATFNTYPGLIITREEAVAMADAHTTVLCSNCAPVAEYNTAISERLFGLGDLIPTPMVHSDLDPLQVTSEGIPELSGWLLEKGFHNITHAALGARVIMDVNEDLYSGAVNGAFGVVSDAVFMDGTRAKGHVVPCVWPTVKSLEVTIQHTGVMRKITRSVTAYKHHRGQRFTKRTFPLALAYAITGHKSQGATIDSKVIVHVTDAFCPGLLYVMLSRVTKRSLLHVVGRLTSDMFNPMRIQLKKGPSWVPQIGGSS